MKCCPDQKSWGEINTLHVRESREQKIVDLTDVQEIYTVLSKLLIGVSQRYCARTLQTRPALVNYCYSFHMKFMTGGSHVKPLLFYNVL